MYPPPGREDIMKLAIRIAATAALAAMLAPTLALAQFSKDKTLTLFINFGVGGNADTDGRATEGETDVNVSRYVCEHHMF